MSYYQIKEKQNKIDKKHTLVIAGALFPHKPSSPRFAAQAFTRSSSSVSGSAGGGWDS